MARLSGSAYLAVALRLRSTAPQLNILMLNVFNYHQDPSSLYGFDRPAMTVDKGENHLGPVEIVRYLKGGKLHRENGPALIRMGPTRYVERWAQNGQLYRADGGPTVVQIATNGDGGNMFEWRDDYLISGRFAFGAREHDAYDFTATSHGGATITAIEWFRRGNWKGPDPIKIGDPAPKPWMDPHVR
jgi:hypothetical protein